MLVAEWIICDVLVGDGDFSSSTVMERKDSALFNGVADHKSSSSKVSSAEEGDHDSERKGIDTKLSSVYQRGLSIIEMNMRDGFTGQEYWSSSPLVIFFFFFFFFYNL
jgi:hypothetical protein